MQPQITLVLVAVGLIPAVTLQMTNHPAGVHLVTGSAYLGMQGAAGDGGEASIGALVHIIAYKAGAEAFRSVEQEVVNLRLGMSVGQISGPVTPVVEHLAQYHVGVGGDLCVKDGVYSALCGVAELAQWGASSGT